MVRVAAQEDVLVIHVSVGAGLDVAGNTEVAGDSDVAREGAGPITLKSCRPRGAHHMQGRLGFIGEDAHAARGIDHELRDATGQIIFVVNPKDIPVAGAPDRRDVAIGVKAPPHLCLLR
jgi:hypothetical protein